MSISFGTCLTVCLSVCMHSNAGKISAKKYDPAVQLTQTESYFCKINFELLSSYLYFPTDIFPKFITAGVWYVSVCQCVRIATQAKFQLKM